jgi:hypothetical protein
MAPDPPFFAFNFLVAPCIDHNIFLMARVRDEALTHGTGGPQRSPTTPGAGAGRRPQSADEASGSRPG